MMRSAHKHRSRFYHLITNLHVADESKLARMDCWGIVLAGLLAVLVTETVRLLLAVN